jgi:hypothetical protein
VFEQHAKFRIQLKGRQAISDIVFIPLYKLYTPRNIYKHKSFSSLRKKMVEQSAFRGVIELLAKIGVYDIILPFLLVFTIMFAILEKTKVLGIDKLKSGDEITKKNLNSMVAFVTAFLVIASTQLVSIISEVMANMVLLMILAVCFLMLVGVFFTDKQFSLEDMPGWQSFFMILMFISIIVIFLNALDWLKFIVALFIGVDSELTTSFFFIAIILGFMYYIVHDPKPKKGKDKNKGD